MCHLGHYCSCSMMERVHSLTPWDCSRENFPWIWAWGFRCQPMPHLFWVCPLWPAPPQESFHIRWSWQPGGISPQDRCWGQISAEASAGRVWCFCSQGHSYLHLKACFPECRNVLWIACNGWRRVQVIPSHVLMNRKQSFSFHLPRLGWKDEGQCWLYWRYC